MSRPHRVLLVPNPGRASLDGTYLGAPRGHRPFDAEELFVGGWSAIRAATERSRNKLGVTVLAFDGQHGLLGETWIAASVDRVRVAIVGRHPSCSVPVPDRFGELPLRHLAVVVRAQSHEDVEVRVLDLHTDLGFGDEIGRTLQALRLSGSAFISIAELRIAILETHKIDPSAGPEEAYRELPARVFAQEEPGPYLGGPRLVRSRDEDGMTHVMSQLGPLAATTRLVDDDEPVRAHMTLGGSGMAVTRPVGAAALRRGILVGRYSHSDVKTGQDSLALSRVHAMIVEDRGQVLLIDTASSNGTWVDGREMWVVRLDLAKEAWLANPRDGLGIQWEEG